MIDAWAEFSKLSQNVELTLVGDGDLREEVDRRIAASRLANVRLTGYLPYKNIAKEYLRADVFILPTLEDLFSLVVTEAMAFALPVITTIYNGARELIVEGENGFIFDPLSEAQFVEVLQKATRSRGRLAEMGRKSLAIIKDYTHDKVMTRMAEILEAELPYGTTPPTERILR